VFTCWLRSAGTHGAHTLHPQRFLWVVETEKGGLAKAQHAACQGRGGPPRDRQQSVTLRRSVKQLGVKSDHSDGLGGLLSNLLHLFHILGGPSTLQTLKSTLHMHILHVLYIKIEAETEFAETELVLWN